ncbi:HAD family hydrolase [Nocardia sp. NPDC059177]|uniref:HAD family hydrolase n=1 Tax=Nocardia sp. NPDC059177 TaxID=3346759 RepID=UPI00367E0ACC
MIFSRNAFGGAEAVEKECVEYYEGEPLSYMTTTAVASLRALAVTAPVVPTTTRTIEQFQRITLPGAPWRYAITSNGGNILVDGVPDPTWRSDIDDQVRASGATLAEVGAELRSRIDDSWVTKYREADELFCYLVVRIDAVPAGFLAEWDTWCRAHGWSASQQGRKIYTMPDAVCKSLAVAEVRRRLRESGELSGDAPLFTAGDGALDAPMLRVADAAIRPRHGELEDLNFTAPALTVTETTGILAGAEILDWFHAKADSTVPVVADPA